ncbi:MAG TPA: mechanosensitive ion channel domain-containing protein [Candidatus Aquilonibacter sp.]|nr:mechanosensitive ion channel domain-containing protein [Candidatus Aquilonibacter sp.]
MSGPFVQFTGPNHALTLGGVKLLGVNTQNGHKLLFTLILFVGLYALSKILRFLARSVGGERQKTAFWAGQGISLTTFILAILGFCSIWFDNPARLTTGVGLVSAGVAFALQKVITSFAGYFVILRGKTFNVGDRIKMGNVRGDVISLNFIQTVIMEMGEPPSVQNEDPGMWVQSRQYSGRIVTVANSKIFEDPVYNYTRDFPYIWEEMHFPIQYGDRQRAEPIILDAIAHHTQDIAELAQPELEKIKARFFIEAADLKPRSYMRITDNWIEFTVRFLVHTHKIRTVKDAISREIMDGLDAAKIGIASGTYNIVGLPPIRIESASPQSASPPQR